MPRTSITVPSMGCLYSARVAFSSLELRLLRAVFREEPRARLDEVVVLAELRSNAVYPAGRADRDRGQPAAGDLLRLLLEALHLAHPGRVADDLLERRAAEAEEVGVLERRAEDRAGQDRLRGLHDRLAVREPMFLLTLS